MGLSALLCFLHPSLAQLRIQAARMAKTSSPFSRFSSALGPLAGLVLVTGIFTLINGRGFLSLFNLQTILADAAITAIAALGMTLVIIGGGIDLSVGSVVALASVMCAKALASLAPEQAQSLPPAAWAAAFAAGIAIGALCGLVNGLAVVGLRVVPFIATLGMLSVARGLGQVADQQRSDQPSPMPLATGFSRSAQAACSPRASG